MAGIFTDDDLDSRRPLAAFTSRETAACLERIEALRQAVNALVEQQVPVESERMRSMHDVRSEFSVGFIRRVRALDEIRARLEHAFRTSIERHHIVEPNPTLK